MAQKKKLPIGVEGFEKLIKNDFYYVDKTGLIIDLLKSWSEVTLFTRPRRFGKSLNMSMLEAFFSPESDKRVFDGLQISGENGLCEEYMGKYPVVSISLKKIEAASFEIAYEQACQLIRNAAVRVDEQIASRDRSMESSKEVLHAAQRRNLDKLLQDDIGEADLCAGLYTLSEVLEKIYGQKVILLIDEYDVPLAKAFEYGYYDQMVIFIRSLFQQALKTNKSLKFAVLTGCMRISKESIFTGLNNLQVLTVSDPRMDAYFGFTDREVRNLLAYYDLSDKYNVVKEWYDGYCFGNEHIYCPWDVINYCSRARADEKAFPENYWINSSGNNVVRKFIAHSSNTTTRNEIEALINGESVDKAIRQELTYQDMYTTIDNLWSVLFTSGYLTYTEQLDERRFRLVIPNQEIRSVFSEQIMEFFRESVQKDVETLRLFYESLKNGDAQGFANYFSNYLRKTISIRDTAVRAEKENFYHGILLGVLGLVDTWGVMSNQESGEGYADILIRSNDFELAMVIEIKYAEDGNMEAACRKALDQIEEKHYAEKLYYEGYDRILNYGVGCYHKRCAACVKEQDIGEFE